MRLKVAPVAKVLVEVRATDLLRTSIVTGALTPGVRITETVIAEQRPVIATGQKLAPVIPPPSLDTRPFSIAGIACPALFPVPDAKGADPYQKVHPIK